MYLFSLPKGQNTDKSVQNEQKKHKRLDKGGRLCDNDTVG
jgi:hypothetical protein